MRGKITKIHIASMALTALLVVFCVFYASLYFSDTAVPGDIYNFRVEGGEFKASETPVLDIGLSGKESGFISSLPGLKPKLQKITLVGPNGEERVIKEEGDLRMVKGQITQIEVERGASFRPGKYKAILEFEKGSGTYTLEQDFTWGVLAINFNKSIYIAKSEIRNTNTETNSNDQNTNDQNVSDFDIRASDLSDKRAFIQMGVLDDAGHTICDASLKLEIRNPKSETQILTTEDNSIQKSETCAGDSVNPEPDYFAYYNLPGSTGTYEVELTATTKNGTQTTSDSFEVRELVYTNVYTDEYTSDSNDNASEASPATGVDGASVPFDVERTGPTRIYPVEPYDMTLTITANQDFSGDITETVPSSFQIIGSNFKYGVHDIHADALRDKTKKIIWKDIELQAGESIEINYTFDAPDKSPQFYLLGPLALKSEIRNTNSETNLNDQNNNDQNISDFDIRASNLLFEEQRQWQIASDATLPTIYVDSTAGDGDDSVDVEDELANTCDTVNCSTSVDISGGDDDSTYVVNNNFNTGTATQGFQLDDMPSDFQNMDSATATFRLQDINDTTDNESVTLQAQLVEADGTTTLTGLDTVHTHDGSDGSFADFTVSFSNLNTAANASVWNGAELELTWDYTKDKGSESLAIRVAGAEIEGEYTQVPPGFDVSGVLREADGLTIHDCSSAAVTLQLREDGAGTDSTVCNASSGAYTFTGLGASANTLISVWASDNTFSTAFSSDGSAVSDVDLYQNTVILRDDDDASIASTDLANCDATACGAGVGFEEDGAGNLTVSDNWGLHIWTGDTYAPGGTVTTSPSGDSSTADGDIEIASSATLDMASNNLSVGGDFTNDGTYSKTAPQLTTFSATATSQAITTSTSNFDDVTFNGSGGEWSFGEADTIEGNLTMTDGTLNGTNNLTVNGDATGTSGVINLTGGLFEQRVSAASTFATSSGTANWTFNNLTFSNSTGGALTVAAHNGGTGTIEVAEVLTIGLSGDSAGTTLDAGDRSWILSDSDGCPCTPFVIDGTNGTFTANTSTFDYTGAGATNITAATYNNLESSPAAAVTHTLGTGASQTITVNNNFVAGDGTNALVLTAATNDPTLSVTGTTTINANATFTQGAGTHTLSGDLTIDGTIDGSDAGTIQAQSNVTGSGLTNITGGTLEHAVATTGITFGSTSGSNTWTFNNLTFDNTASTASDVTWNTGGTGPIDVDGNFDLTTTGTGAFTVDNESNDRVLDIEGNFTLASSTTFQASSAAAFNIAGSYSNSGTFTAGSGTVTFDDTAGSKTLSGTMTGTSAFNNVDFNGSGGGWSLNAAAELSGDLTMTAGTLSGTNNLTVNGGNATGDGDINLTGGTFTLDGAGSFGGATAWDFNNLTIGGDGTTETTTSTGAGGITVAGTLTIGANQTLDAGSKIWTLTNTGTPFVVNGTFTANSSRITYTGAGATTLTAESYWNLEASSSATATFTPEAGTFTVNNNFRVGDGTNPTVFAADTNDPALDVAGNVNIGASSTLEASATANFNVAGSWSNSGTFTHNSGTVTFDDDNGDAAETLNGGLSGTSAFANVNFNGSSATWNINSNFETATGTGTTWILNSGTIDQGAGVNILLKNEIVTFESGTIYNADSGGGLLILDGIDDNQVFTDNTTGQNFGDVHIGQSPGTTNLNSDFAANSLTVNSGDTFNTRGWEVDIATFITVNGTMDASDSGGGGNEGDGSIITLGTDWTVASAATWVADEDTDGTFTTVTFDESTAGTITTGGTDQFHDFYRVNISKTAAATVDMATDDIVINENFSITNSNSTFDVTASACSGSVSCNMTVGGDWLNNSSGVFNEQTGLVTLTGGSAASATHTTDEGGAFHDLTLDDSADGDTFLLGSALDVDGNLTITSGTLDTESTNDYAVNIAGNYTNNGTFTANQSTVTIDGANQQTLGGTLTGSSAFYDLTFTNSSGTDASDDERTDFVPGVIFNTDASATSTFAITTGSVRVEYSSGNTYTFTNINWNGQGAGTEIYFRNSTTSNDWKLDVTCTSCPVSYVNVSRSDASGGSTIDATDGTNYDGGNNINWNFPVTLTVSGTVYDTDESTATTSEDGTAIKLVNAASAATSYDTTIDGSGNFSFTGVAESTDGDDLVIWVSGSGTYKGTLVVEYGSGCSGYSDCTGLSVYEDRVILRSEDDGTIANSDLANCDNDTGAACSDTDIGYTSNGGDLTASDGRELHIYSGDTFTPGGTVTTSPSSDSTSADGDVHIDTSATLDMEGNALSIGGDYTNEGTFSFSVGQGTTFTASSSGHVIDPGSSTHRGFIFNSSGGSGVWSIANNDLTLRNFEVQSGTVDNSNGSANITSTGFVRCQGGSCGTINFTSASHTFTAQPDSSGLTFGTDETSAVDWTFANLTFDNIEATSAITTTNGSGTGDINVTGNLSLISTGGGDLTIDNSTATGGDRNFDINGNFIINSSTTWQAGDNSTLEVAGNFTNNGTFTANSGEVIFDDNSKTTTFTGDTTFFSLTSTTASKDLTFSANSTTSIGSSGAITLNGSACTSLITLRSTVGGTDWLLDIDGAAAQDMQFIDVADSNATATGATATNSTDSGHNTNWSIDDTCFDDVFITSGTYNNLEVYPASSTTRHIFGTATSQSITTDGYLKVGDGTGTGLGDAFFYNPGLDVGTNFTISSNANFSAPYSSSFSIAANWTSNGTFINNQGEVAFDDASQQSVIAGATRFFDFLSTAAGNTLLFTAGETFGIDGLLTLTGGSGNEIIINSTDDDGTPTQWFVDHQGTEDTSFANIKNSGCDTDSTDIDVFTSDGNIDSGNNDDCWIFEAGFTITGTLHQEDESTPYDCSTDGGDNDVDLKLSVEGSAASTAICSASSGAYTFTNVSAAANSTITIWADGNTTFTGSLAYSTDGSAISNADLYQDRVVLRDDDNANLATTDLASCDSDTGTGCSDTDIGFTEDGSGNLTVLDGYELHIWTGDTYTPGGTVTTSPSGLSTDADGDVHIASSATLDMGTNNLSIGGDFDNEGTYSKTAPQLTTFSATATSQAITTGASNFDDVEFNGSGGGWSFGDSDDTIEGNFTITDGTVTAPSGTLTVNGDFNDNNTAGGFTHNSGTVAFGSGAHNIGGATTSGGDFVTFNNFTAQSAGSTLVFEVPGANDGEIRIEGKFTVESEDGNDIHIHSSAASTQWLIDHQGTESVQYAHIQDSGCASTTTNISLDSTSTNDSNNDESCWLFPAASFTLDSTSINLDMNDSNTFTASANNTLTVQSQSENGFKVRAYQTQFLTEPSTSNTIQNWSGTYESPTAWTGNCIDNGECGWGYNTDDADIGFGSSYAAFAPAEDAPGDSISEATTDTDLTDDVVIISYKSSVLSSQPAGEYQTTIIYILTPTF